jgi:hypothetical protein
MTNCTQKFLRFDVVPFSQLSACISLFGELDNDTPRTDSFTGPSARLIYPNLDHLQSLVLFSLFHAFLDFVCLYHRRRPVFDDMIWVWVCGGTLLRTV